MKVDDGEAREHLLDGQELPILRSPSARGDDSVSIRITVDETGRVTSAVATDAPADVRMAAVAAVLHRRYRPFLVDGRPRAATFDDGLSYYPPQILPSRHVAFPAGDPATVRIRLERGGCLGACPVYQVEIGGDGAVTYRGKYFVAIIGDHHAGIPPAAVAALVDRFRAADFFSLQDAYQAQFTDQTFHRVTLQIGGRTKSVVDYVGLSVGMPDAVARLEGAIDHAAGTRRWVKGDDETMAALKAEHWDFTSREAGRSLIRIAGNGPEDLALALLDAGAPLETESAPLLGRSALEVAFRAGRVSLARALIAHGALSQGGPDAAERALIAAASSRRADAVTEALAHHPDVNRVTDDGSALMNAAAVWPFDPRGEDGAAAVVRLLLQARADPNLKNSRGETALHKAGTAEIVRLLVKAGARLEMRDGTGSTPLLAVSNEDAAIALVDAGADVHARDNTGADILQLARQNQWKRLAARLSRR